MDNNFTIRLFSLFAGIKKIKIGFSRIELLNSSTFLDLKKQILAKLNVQIKEQKLFYDKDNKKAIIFPESTQITKLNLK